VHIALGLDIGTSKLCALAWREGSTNPLAVRSVPNDADLTAPAGRHEQDPARICEQSFALLAGLVQDLGPAAQNLRALGITGQMHGVLLADASGAPLTPLVTWRDQRALGDDRPGSLAWARARVPAGAPARTGCELHAGYGGVTLAWLAAHEAIPPGAMALTIADFVAAALTGVLATEPTHAASWGLLDLAQSAWHAPLVQALGIPAGSLPRLRPSGMPLGPLRPETARALGLAATVRVCAPVGDNQASVLSALGNRRDAAVLNLGTGGQISVPSASAQYTPGLETRPLPFGGFLHVGASLCGGWSYAYLCRFFRAVTHAMTGTDPGEDAAYTRMQALIAAAPDSQGLTADTRFSGTRGAPDLTGAITGITRENLTPAHLARAVLEGMIRELADMTRALELRAIREILGTGNAVRRNPAVPGFVAQIFGRPCSVPAAQEEAALGAALCAARGTAAPDA